MWDAAPSLESGNQLLSLLQSTCITARKRHWDSPFEVGLMDSLEKVGRPDLPVCVCVGGDPCAVSEWELYILPVGKKRKQCRGGSIPGGD